MSTKNRNKPNFNVDQLVSTSQASKNFGELRKRAKISPLFITDNGSVDTVLISYDSYEKIYQRLMELEEKEEARIIIERIQRIDSDPSLTVSWKPVHRSGRKND